MGILLPIVRGGSVTGGVPVEPAGASVIGRSNRLTIGVRAAPGSP